jgi:hypothetical protein
LSNFLSSPLVASKASSDALPLLAAGGGGYIHIMLDPEVKLSPLPILPALFIFTEKPK